MDVARRTLVLGTLGLGLNYLLWRYFNSINWNFWPLALALVLAETYSAIDGWLFGLSVWRPRRRVAPPPPPEAATVDIFITCYNEPVELVCETVRAAAAIRYPHRTYVLDDGSSAAMRAMAHAEGVGYIVRSTDWTHHERHAKAGNLNNALFQTQGAFILILDADQIPSPEILDRTLGYFDDPRVAFVQTPQWFYNVPPGDPLGSQAPLFYGPIMQGKDGWNAAFFCGSNAVLRREALMQLGIAYYVRELEWRVRRALSTADRVLRTAERQLTPAAGEHASAALRELRVAVADARRDLRMRAPIQDVTWTFQRRAEGVSRLLVADDLARIRAELADIPGLDVADLEDTFAGVLDDEEVLADLAGRAASPLAAIGAVRSLLFAVDVDRAHEAQPLMPLATISVTEDMATAMRLHALGWRSVYHHEVLARGLAPEDLRSALQQRLRWAQGTIQVLLRENPLGVPGLSLVQRLMYFATMWSYLSGFATVVYIVGPILYMAFGWLPVSAFSATFFTHLVPYLVVNQLMFLIVGWGIPVWRGQQYSFALFPLWIRAVTSAVGNVVFGQPLGFVVTPKTRQGGVHLRLVWPQLVAVALLCAVVLVGLARLALGVAEDGFATLVNVAWAAYDLALLSVVVRAVTFQPASTPLIAASVEPGESAAEAHGRVGAGSA